MTGTCVRKSSASASGHEVEKNMQKAQEFHAKAQRTQRRKGAPETGSHERLCVFAFFALLREILVPLVIKIQKRYFDLEGFDIQLGHREFH